MYVNIASEVFVVATTHSKWFLSKGFTYFTFGGAVSDSAIYATNNKLT